jgi:hypothetical protein
MVVYYKIYTHGIEKLLCRMIYLGKIAQHKNEIYLIILIYFGGILVCKYWVEALS